MKNCFNCALCSEYYPSLKDMCDIDEHEIKDIYNEHCDSFVQVEEETGT